MRYVLYSVSQNARVSDLFTTEAEIWTHARVQGLYSDVVDREDLELQTILNPGYEIDICDSDGQRLDDGVIRQWPRPTAR
jgi:hypothetical protein